MLRSIRFICAALVVVFAAACSETAKPTSPVAAAETPNATAVAMPGSSGKSTICQMYRTQLRTSVTLREASEARMSSSDIAQAKTDEKELQDAVSDVCN